MPENTASLEVPVIYVVDDDADVRESLETLLQAAGYQSLAFASGVQFLEQLNDEFRGCVLLDVRMPGKSGLQIQQLLASQHAGLPVIMITGHGDVPMAVSAMKAGAFDFIEKPFSDESLLTCIEKALDWGRKIENRLAEAQAYQVRFESLTPRERDVLRHLVAGSPNKIIAYELGISPRTVEIHRARVMEKTQARSLSELVRMALALDKDGEGGTDPSEA